MPKQFVIVYPDNTSHAINSTNPYVQLDSNDPDDVPDDVPDDPTMHYQNNQMQATNGTNTNGTNTNGTNTNGTNTNDSRYELHIPPDLIAAAIKIDQMTCTVRTVCLFDIFISTLYFLNGAMIGIIAMVASTNGYFATIYYKKSLMCCYVGYQFFQVLIRFANLLYIILQGDVGSTRTVVSAATTTNVTNTNKTNNTTDATTTSSNFNYFDNYATNIVILAFLFLCQCIITGLVYQYYTLLPSNEQKRRIQQYIRRRHNAAGNAHATI